MERLKEHSVSLIGIFGTAILGLGGMYLAIPHAGWMLAVSVFIALNHEW